MVSTVGLFVKLEAKPGKEGEVADILRSGLSIVQGEPATLTWYAVRMGPTTFGIFDTFPDDAGRRAHLAGRVAAALTARADERFARPPTIDRIDILAEKIDADAAAATIVEAGG
jgi:quinol monooxygenase YgiN